MNPLDHEKCLRIAEIIYEATRKEAEWSERPIVPEQWDRRDQAFRTMFTELITRYLGDIPLPTPQEAHESWMRAYWEMGWVYGEKRDPIAKTHPDLVPFDKLPKSEQDKDAIFLAMVWLARSIVNLD